MLRLTETLISKKIIISTISRSSFDTHVTHYEELILLHIYDCKEELILKKLKKHLKYCKGTVTSMKINA